jgi:hypothetical protein
MIFYGHYGYFWVVNLTLKLCSRWVYMRVLKLDLFEDTMRNTQAEPKQREAISNRADDCY